MITLSSIYDYSESLSIPAMIISHLLRRFLLLITLILFAISLALYLYYSIVWPSFILRGILSVGSGLLRLERLVGDLLLNMSIILSNGSIVVLCPFTL